MLRTESTTADACIPIAMLSRADVLDLGLDARALFVFAFIDDRTPVFELLTMSGMPLTDAADALASLCAAGAVALAEEIDQRAGSERSGIVEVSRLAEEASKMP